MPAELEQYREHIPPRELEHDPLFRHVVVIKPIPTESAFQDPNYYSHGVRVNYDGVRVWGANHSVESGEATIAIPSEGELPIEEREPRTVKFTQFEPLDLAFSEPVPGDGMDWGDFPEPGEKLVVYSYLGSDKNPIKRTATVMEGTESVLLHDKEGRVTYSATFRRIRREEGEENFNRGVSGSPVFYTDRDGKTVVVGDVRGWAGEKDDGTMAQVTPIGEVIKQHQSFFG